MYKLKLRGKEKQTRDSGTGGDDDRETSTMLIHISKGIKHRDRKCYFGCVSSGNGGKERQFYNFI